MRDMLNELRKIRCTCFCLSMAEIDHLNLPPYKGSTFNTAVKDLISSAGTKLHNSA